MEIIAKADEIKVSSQVKEKRLAILNKLGSKYNSTNREVKFPTLGVGFLEDLQSIHNEATNWDEKGLTEKGNKAVADIKAKHGLVEYEDATIISETIK